MAEKILLIEDEEKLARMVELELRYEGYEVEKAFDGRTGLDRALSGEHELILLDIMLPALSGMEVLRRLRRESQVPVIMLTARDTVVDKVSGLDSGADDYITKPFAIEELLARIRTMTRKHAGSRTDTLTVGDLVLDTRGRTAARAGRDIPLLPKEYAILEHLVRHAGTVLSREQLEDRIWNYEKAGSSNNIDGYMSRLRKKIDADVPESQRLLHTVRGSGWVLRAPKEGGTP